MVFETWSRSRDSSQDPFLRVSVSKVSGLVSVSKVSGLEALKIANRQCQIKEVFQLQTQIQEVFNMQHIGSFK